MKSFSLIVSISIVVISANVYGLSKPCIQQNFGYGSTVCVCNSTYCDFIGPIVPELGTHVIYTSSRNGKRFEKSTGDLVSRVNTSYTLLTLNDQTSYQTIKGFGGAFSDSVGLNILKLSESAQVNLLKSYFSADGLEYNIGRVPIGGTDFSTRPYTYDDDNVGDFALNHWALQYEDTNYKIPIVKRARDISPNPIKLIAAPWSAPAWMKTSGAIKGAGTLIGNPGEQFYKTWANYIVKFLDTYKSNGIEFWGLSVQNQPSDGFIKDFPINTMGLTPPQEADFIKLDLGPALSHAGYNNVSLMIFEDQRIFLSKHVEKILKDPETSKYVDGIAVHWYTDDIGPAALLTNIHKKFPNKYLLSTEACVGQFDNPVVKLGSWKRAEAYAKDIAEDLLHWVEGWVDWNLCLDKMGGPNWASNFVDAPVIVDGYNDLFYKQPMFYILGHFSKFIRPGSVRIDIKSNVLPANIDAVAFKGQANSRILIVVNRSDKEFNLAIADPSTLSRSIQATAPQHSIQSYIWWAD